ncbi:MAG: ATP-binding protein [Candidatus Nanohaloarchaea archaeon]
MEKPESCDVGIEVDGYYTGLSKQQMDFQDALAELVDNAISANISSEDYFEEENPDESFDIEINIVRNEGDTVEVIVADSGEGIDPETLSSHIWKSGDRSQAGGILNEHGFGLKNSLSVLTKNEGEEPFKIISRTSEYEDDEFAVVKGPIGRDMPIEYIEDSDLWEEGAGTLTDMSTGTRVHLETDMDVVRSTYRR